MSDKKRMVITDLDGTLLQRGSVLDKTDKNTLVQLGDKDIVRVIATGRNLFSAKKVICDDFPIDYLVFSSGGGIVDWKSKELLLKTNLATKDIETILDILLKQSLDFMIHHPIPDNHHFAYLLKSKDNPDFLRRIELYQDYAYTFDVNKSTIVNQASQFLVIIPNGIAMQKYILIKERLNTLNIIRTTSPLDGKSFWIEILPINVSKAIAGEWIARKEGVDVKDTLSLGNDYNDLDLLNWGGLSFVVANAPELLRKTYPVVSSNNDNGFTEAVGIWKSS